MKKTKFIISFFLLALTFQACINDLDVTPKDPSTVLSANLSDDPAYMSQFLGKIYASFLIHGQAGNKPDIAASDVDFFTTTRAIWNLQQLPTDEAICGWGDVGISDLNTQTWSPANPFLTALYQRLGLSITYANEFIRNAANSTDTKVMRYVAEARFLRALAYAYYIDLFGNPPFITEADAVGKFQPSQLDPNFNTGRTKLFNYIVSELLDIEDKLGAPGFSYPNADKATAWMLLSRMYLNAEVYTGTAKWDSVLIYTNKVIESNKYQLASNYRQNFSADNGGNENPEMIFAWAQDGQFIQGWVGTTFIIQSSSDAAVLPSAIYHGLTVNTNWNGNRARRDFLNVMIDTIATYGNVPVPYETDTLFKASKDKRVFLRVKAQGPFIPSASSNGDYGIGVYKFTSRLSDGSFPVTFNSSYANTDYPIFRYADALMMRAEAYYRLGNLQNAVDLINMIRERAFGDSSGNITTAQLTDEFMMNERSREFYYEGHRRTDMIRFGQFTNGSYVWNWKGGVYEGTQVSPHMNVYPIPADEVAANPNIRQNPGY